MLTISTNTIAIAHTKKRAPLKRSFSFLHNKNKSMEQHVAQLYAEKPYLQHYYMQQPLHATSSTDFNKKFKKYMTFFSKYGIDFSMLLYCSYAIYVKHSEIYAENADLTKNSGLKNKILEYIPKNIINAPKHTCFFFDSLEIIIKAFVVKTIIKLLIFFVEVG